MTVIPKLDNCYNDILPLALTHIEIYGWENFSYSRLSKESNIPLGDLTRLFPTKISILKAWGEKLDQGLLNAHATIQDESDHMRDRLFALIMARFDQLQEHKGLVKQLWASKHLHPNTAISGLSAFLHSSHRLLDVAGISTSGIKGLIKVQAFGILFLSLLPYWLDDESEDSAQLMYRLDQRLSELQNLAELFNLI